MPVDWGKRPSKQAPAKGKPPSALDAFVQDDKRAVKRLNLNIPSDLHRRVKTGCAAEGLDMTEVILRFLEERFPSM
jgi:hypothetical protein